MKAMLLEACVYFSSVAGLIGGAGQSNYSSSNAQLDACALLRRAQGCNGASVAWGPWAMVGMASANAINSRMSAMGLGLIDPWQGLATLHAAFAPQRQPAVLAFWLVRWDVMLGGGKPAPAMLMRLTPRVATNSSSAGRLGASLIQPSPQRARLGGDAVREIVGRTAGGAIDADAPLTDAGLDSLGAVELQNLLQQAVGEGTPLPATLAVDYPTTRNLVAYFETQTASPSAFAGAEAVEVRAVGLDAVLDIVRRTGGPGLDADAPMMEAGLDSLGAVELTNQLQQAVGEALQLPSTLVADYPSARQIASILATHATAAVPTTSGAAAASTTRLAAADVVPLDLSSLSARLVSAFDESRAQQEHPCLVHLRSNRVESGTAPPANLVIVHSFLGDESGYERLWKLNLASHSIYAMRHRFLAYREADETPLPSAHMLSQYATALTATFQTDAFDLIGASYGSLVAHHLAHVAAAQGATPRRLTLIDPFPFWPRIRETAPNSALLSLSGEQDNRSAAHFILKLRLLSQHGPDKGEAMLAELAEELASVPNDAIGLFLAAQALPAEASREKLLVQALREQRSVMAVASVGPTILELVEEMPVRAAAADGEADVLIVLGSQRRDFFEYVYGAEGFDDRLDPYGRALPPVHVEGEHFEVVARCISNRVPEFTEVLEDFLTRGVSKARCL